MNCLHQSGSSVAFGKGVVLLLGLDYRQLNHDLHPSGGIREVALRRARRRDIGRNRIRMYIHS